jgi:hypothetical protein
VKQAELGSCRVDLGRQLLDQADVGVCDEKLRIGARKHHDSHVRVFCELAPEPVHVADQCQVEKIDRRMIDRDERDPAIDLDPYRVVAAVAHK